ncbi:YitT family protein [Clostridium perfringens]|uniref:YitT family protein n=1 Tax=Clostridium perfringens TaxID=1502 RepID=UPI001F06C4EC|nr:YitT family protein [Clostridium perfringens]
MESKKKILRSVLLIALGSSILAFGSYNFNYQNNVTEGGVLGLLLLVKNVFDISPSITNLIIDFSLFAIGSKFFGKKFLACSIFATFCFSVSYRFWESIGFLTPNFTNNMLVASVLAGIGVGVGAGIVLRGGGASGGDDVIALLGNKFTPLKVQHVYMLTDAIVLLMSLVYLDFKQIFFSIIAVCISGKLISVIYEYKNDGIDTKDEDKEAEVLEKNGSLTV